MRLKAIHLIQVPGRKIQPGAVFSMPDETEARRLIRLGAAEPVKREIRFSTADSTQMTGGQNRG